MRITFKRVATEWFTRWSANRVPDYAKQSWQRLQTVAMPTLGNLSIDKIKPPQILQVLRSIEDHSVAVRKVKGHISQIMRYGIACGYVMSDPARDIGFALMPHKITPRPAILDQKEIGQLLLKINNMRARQRKCALKLLLLTFVRVGELVTAEWDDFDFDNAIWHIPAEKMKMKKPHDVPLATQTIELIRSIPQKSNWLFPCKCHLDQHEDPGSCTLALRRMGYSKDELTAHGFRAMAATKLSELNWHSEVIERQLAHSDQNKVRAAYQRSPLLDERRRMMQNWADWLDMRLGMAVLGR